MRSQRASGLPRIGIVTALPREFKAVLAMVADHEHVELSDKGADNTYVLGNLPGRKGTHRVAVLLLPDTGNNSSGIGAALLTSNYPSIECVFMVGIAGGIPDPGDAAEHVRLGDIVLSGRDGVVQYDIGKMLPDRLIARFPPRPPSARMLQATRMLSALDYQCQLYGLIDAGLAACGSVRPSDASDFLGRSDDPRMPVEHPKDSQRIPARPRIFVSAIASANQVLKSPVRRDQLRDEHRAKAVEMEGSGIADLAWTKSIEYFVVRGISDYCDTNKRDDWQDYAAVVAAAYTRLLLSSLSASAKGSIWGRTAMAAAVPLAVLSTMAWIHDGVADAKTSWLYVEAERPPVELRIDGVFVRSLTTDLPFTSLELTPGTHNIEAIGGERPYEQSVTLKQNARTVVRIPAPK